MMTAGGSQDFSFLHENRLLVKQDFDRVFNSKKKLIDKYVVVIVEENNLNIPRLGVIVSKKQVRDSVKRNRIKRLVRESFRKHKDLLLNIDVVIIARKPSDALTNEEFFCVMDKKWKQLRDLFARYIPVCNDL